VPEHPQVDAGNVYITLDIFRAELARIWANAHVYYYATLQCKISIRATTFSMPLVQALSVLSEKPMCQE
jgi:hypothetical protein